MLRVPSETLLLLFDCKQSLFCFFYVVLGGNVSMFVCIHTFFGVFAVLFFSILCNSMHIASLTVLLY